jgi:hydrogenase-4 component E
MINLLIVLFGLTLIYFALSERVNNYIVLLGIQGVLLFTVAFYNLRDINIIGLVFILLETIVVKAILIPYFLNRVRRHNNLKRVHEHSIPVFYSVLIIVLLLVISFVIGNQLEIKSIQSKFFSISIASLLSGLFFIIIHKNVFSHLVGYLIIENGMFLLSLAVGNEMPVLVSLAILVDLFIGILVIGIFLNKVGDAFQSISIDELSQLKN